MQVLALILGHELADRDQQWWVADDPGFALLDPDQAIECLEAVPPLGLCGPLSCLLKVPRRRDLREIGQDAIDVEPRVPDFEVAHRGEVTHRLAVGARCAEDHGPDVLRREAAVAPGNGRRQSLDVPLPRPKKGLVEVVQVPHEPPVGRGEDAEVREVGIAAQLNSEPRGGRVRQIHRHDRGAAAIEREGGGEHAPVADRHELGDPAPRLILEDVYRIATLRRRLPSAVARARHCGSRRLSRGCALSRRGIGA